MAATPNSASIAATEIFNFSSVEGGLRPGTMSFKAVSMASSGQRICVREAQPDGMVSLVVANLCEEDPEKASERLPMKSVDGAIMHPSSKIVALRSGDQVQVFDLDAKKKVSSITLTDDVGAVTFWCWIDDETIALITETDVFHWNVNAINNNNDNNNDDDDNNGASSGISSGISSDGLQHIFNRSDDMDGVQILSYNTDKDKCWLMLCGIGRGVDGTLTGKTLLHSTENGASRVLDGHAGAFVSMPTPDDPRPSNIMCLAWNDATAGGSGSGIGHLLIMELPTESKPDPSIGRQHIVIPFSSQHDFPVAVGISPERKHITVVSSRGSAVVVDVFSGSTIASNENILAKSEGGGVIFGGTCCCESGGVVCVGSSGSVLRVSTPPGDSAFEE